MLFSIFVAVSIQAPALSTFDIMRVSFKNTSNTFGVNQIRYGVWSACLQRSTNTVNACDGFSPCVPSEEMRICSPAKYGYHSQVGPTNATSESFLLKPTWTRALPLEAAKAIMTTLTFILLVLYRPSGFVMFSTVVIAILTVLTEISFFYHIKYGMKNLSLIGAKYACGPGYGVSVMTFFLIILEAILCIIDLTERSEREEKPTPLPYPYARRMGTLSLSRSYSSIQPASRRVAPPSLRVPESAYTHFPLKRSRSPSIRSVYLEEDFECSICLERRVEDLEAQSNKKYSSLPCKHVFCTRCVSTPYY
ncbi:hypothetical protein SCHPADRAFT_940109 [Schizopora paradoxa]|uniref:RING-type domain-containing protein n=1 Tax=Schizopora paradoxa TaxID=27342 RepID=A0A0H2RQ83_9AGAM|nr:hypothetical protein SCHPADRAFT_940109 [Schizopora paradoxa]